MTGVTARGATVPGLTVPEFTIQLKVREAEAPSVAVTTTDTLEAPTVVGEPDTMPVAASIDNPLGSPVAA